jgi:nucleotide-binding universal stress UspA family protein
METIVVGVDGSVCARAALQFAAREAALRKARLRIVCAWEIPPAVYGGGFAPTLDQPTLDGFRAGAETVAQEAVAAAKELQSTIECEGKAVQGQPAEVLLEEARDADLIVVGNRGHGGSPASCSARSATRSSSTRRVRSPSSARPTTETLRGLPPS